MRQRLVTPSGTVELPAFLPDATVGVVRAVESVDLAQCGVAALVMNTFHLMQHPGSSTIRALGGLHAMSGWSGPIVTDSGGFQAYSLIKQNAKFGSMTDNGIVIRPQRAQRKLLLTPEKCVQLQFSYGADIVMCLDDCTHVDDPPDVQAASVQRTVNWARRSKREYERLLVQKRREPHQRPLLFAVIQGGGSPERRRICAEALLEIGFDGYGYGGWPLDGNGNLLDDLLAYTRALVPAQYALHALGVGHPENVVVAASMGYGLFDSALPTRDARRGRLYTMLTTAPMASSDGWFRFLYITDEKHIKSKESIEADCDCLTCRHYSRGYLHHLFRANEATFQRLATIHNVRFMARLMAILQTDDAEGERTGKVSLSKGAKT